MLAVRRGRRGRGWPTAGLKPWATNYFFTVSVPLTGMPHTVPEYVTTICAALSLVALPFVNVNGQFTPPWLTSPCAVQLSAEPDNVPVPVPLTLIPPPHVAANVTFAAEALTGVTVYLTLPQPVGGVDAVADVHTPANASMPIVGVGDVGVGLEPLSLLLLSSPQPAVRRAVSATGARRERETRMVFSLSADAARGYTRLA